MASRQGGAALATVHADVSESTGTGTFYEVLPISDGVFTAETRMIGMGGLFGGQLSAQGLIAGLRTVPEGWVPHVLHAYFLSSGREGEAITLSVNSLRDGRHSCHRRITITQKDKVVAEVTVIFGVAEESSPHPRVAVPPWGPSDSPENRSIFQTRWNYSDLDIRVPQSSCTDSRRYHPVWIRSAVHRPDDHEEGWATAAFASDLGLVLTALEVEERKIARAVSTDHAVWFHRRPHFDQWHLLDVDREARSGQRATVRAQLVTEDGSLVASAAQGVTILTTRPSESVTVRTKQSDRGQR